MSGGKTVIELRVHGVSGTPPEAMLNCPTEFLQKMHGDEDAGFYRRAQWIDDTKSPPRPDKWRRLMEVYSWGGLTSRRASRALWLLLLPFTLVNLAHWMLPPAARRGPATMVVRLLRLLALSFTLTLLLAMAVSVLDIAVWQCANLDYCSAGWGPLASLSRQKVGCRLAVGALPLIVVIAVLWYLGREDSAPGLSKDKPPGAVVKPDDPSPLADITFWNRDASVARMRSCHVTVWTTGLAALVLAPPMKYATSEAARTGTIALLGANLFLFAVAVVATASTRATGRGGPSEDRKLDWLMRLRWYALALLLASLLWITCREDVPYPTTPTFMPGIRASVYWVLGIQFVLVVAVYIGTWLSMRPPRDESAKQAAARESIAKYGMSLGGSTGPHVALLGWLVGGGLSVGLGLWTAQILGTAVFSPEIAAALRLERDQKLAGSAFSEKVHAVDAQAPLMVPPPYVWASVATMVMIIVVIVVGLFLWLKVIRGRKARNLEELRRSGPVEQSAPPKLQEKIAKTRAWASLTDSGPLLIAGLAVFTVPVVIVVGSLLRWDSGFMAKRFRQEVWIANISVATAASIVVGLVALVVLAFRNRQVRRVVGILWDVVTFWPRANHPLTPPSYGGRTVWDLRVRLGELNSTVMEIETREDQSTRVILVAHSQGTIIAAATLMQATDPEEQYPLLTFGSPLRRLYAQNFPAYFGYTTMVGLRDREPDPRPRWINLWARTDPIGGRVFDSEFAHIVTRDDAAPMAEALPHVECRILDVQQQDPDRREYHICVNGPTCGHSGFWLRGEYVKAVDALQAIVAPDAESNEKEPDSSATVRPKADAM